jgi:hypothetical protein
MSSNYELFRAAFVLSPFSVGILSNNHLKSFYGDISSLYGADEGDTREDEVQNTTNTKCSDGNRDYVFGIVVRSSHKCSSHTKQSTSSGVRR